MKAPSSWQPLIPKSWTSEELEELEELLELEEELLEEEEEEESVELEEELEESVELEECLRAKAEPARTAVVRRIAEVTFIYQSKSFRTTPPSLSQLPFIPANS